MRPFTVALLKSPPPSIIVPSIGGRLPRTDESYAGVRMIRISTTGTALAAAAAAVASACPATCITVSYNINSRRRRRSILSPQAMESWVVSRRSTKGARMPERWRLVPCAHYAAAGATEKGLGAYSGEERRDLVVAGDNGSQDWDPGSCDNSQKGERFEQNREPKRLLTLPTMLTIGRVASVPLLVTTFYMNGWWATTATTTIFIVAAVTDWLDGYIARKMLLGTPFGTFLDPVADKLMVAATLVLLCTRTLEVPAFGQVPWLVTVPSIAIIGREITMSAVREWAASQNSRVLEAVAVNSLGKWKTATQMTALIILLVTRDSSLAGRGVLAASGIGLLYISAGLTVWSLMVYASKIWRLLLK